MAAKSNKLKSLKIGVVLDPMDKLIPAFDSSILIMGEACSRGHKVGYFQDREVVWDGNARILKAKATWAEVQKQEPYFRPKSTEWINLKKLDAIIIRKNPPFDTGYHYLTQLLDLVSKDVFIVNSPHGLRTVNEKLFILNFPQLIAPTVVTADLQEDESFYRDQGRKLILKPLNLYSGYGIMLVNEADGEKKLSEVFTKMTDEGKLPIMLQRYLNIEKGDKRVNLIGGKPIGTLLRLPKPGEYRANLVFGGNAVKTEITKHDRKVAATVAPRLIKEGLRLVGLDLIDGFLTEINVTSPTGFPTMNRLGNLVLESHFLDDLEQQCQER